MNSCTKAQTVVRAGKQTDTYGDRQTDRRTHTHTHTESQIQEYEDKHRLYGDGERSQTDIYMEKDKQKDIKTDRQAQCHRHASVLVRLFAGNSRSRRSIN